MDLPRQQPYRLFFPLGILLTWAAVGHWLLFGLGWIEQYLSIFHAMVQVQGFLICFALGFLFTMVPRRTSSAPPSTAVLAVAFLCPVGTAVAAWREAWPLAQLFWVVLMLTVGVWLVRRFRSGGAPRRPPHGFVWIPVAFAAGLVGAVLTGVGAALAERVEGIWALHEIGRGLVLQGVFLCLVLGVGGFAVPLLTRGEAAPDVAHTGSDRRRLMLHGVAILALLLSFPVEHLVSLRLGLAIRAVIVLVVLVVVAGLPRRPTRPGLVRWLIWLGAGMVPVGYVVAALLPRHWKGALHVSFIGGFALLALSVSSQVVLGHGGYERVRDGRPWPLAAMVVLLLGAAAARLLAELRPTELQLWLAWAAGSFLLATLFWAGLILPPLLRSPRPHES